MAGAIKLYGGHARPLHAGFPYCPALPAPPPATHAVARAFPASSLATASIDWIDPPSPAAQARAREPPPGQLRDLPVRPRREPDRDPALRGSAARDDDRLARRGGRRAVGARHRPDRPRPLVLQRLDRRPSASLHALGERDRADRSRLPRLRPASRSPQARRSTPDIVAGATVAAVTLRFRLPPAPKVEAIRIERLAGDLSGSGRDRSSASLSREPAPTPGDIAVTDSTGLTPGPWCYIVRIQLADRDYEPALVQVTVPTPPPLPAPAPIAPP